MAEGIIDKLMQVFKGIEKDEATLTTIEGGQQIDLFGGHNLVSEDFDTIMEEVFQGDEIGQEMYTKLVDSGQIAKIEELWVMGGKPKLSMYDSEWAKRVPGHPASYSKDTNPNVRPQPEWSGSGTIYIHDPSVSSPAKFDAFIAELAHAIGYTNPAMMELGVEEITDEFGKVLGVSKSGPTYDFLQSLDSFPVPESPSDSLAVWKDWWKSQPESIRKPKGSKYTEEGHLENITHLRIENALRGWLDVNTFIPIDWGAE